MPKDFNVHGLGYMRLTKYGVYFNDDDIYKIIRQAAGIDGNDEISHPGVFAEITIKVRFVESYLHINGKPAGVGVDSPETMEPIYITEARETSLHPLLSPPDVARSKGRA